MATKLIDGKVLAKNVKVNVINKVNELKKHGVYPKLVVFLVGENPASAVYVRGKEKDCEECGIISEIIRFNDNICEEELILAIQRMNEDDTVHGILVQLPLPSQIDELRVIEAISPSKDVDGFTALNTGHLLNGEVCFLPCTPAACVYMIEEAGVCLEGKNVVVVGRSNIVGKPLAMLLLAKNATVTICHSKTVHLEEYCKKADILIAAVGKEKLITADMVKENAIVIDVGMNRNANGKLCGDVDFDAVYEKVSAITPVPGGVGLMTRAMLLENTVTAAQLVSEK